MDATTISPAALTTVRLGIYFGLPMDDYVNDPALGSSDVRLLRNSPTSYWHYSYMNPKRKVETADYLERGTAMHTMLLEGEGAFAATYMRGPVHTDDMTPPEKGAATKMAKKKAAELGMQMLDADDFDRILESREIIGMNPDIANVFKNGFAEVSIFWVRDGVRRKARLDYIKPAGVGDLKSASNKYDTAFDAVCRSAIANYRYDIQAAYYLEARAMIASLLADGLVYGDHDATLLKKIAGTEGVGWQWVFFCTTGAPDAFSYKLVTGNPMLEGAQRDVEIAISRYTQFLAHFGLRRWTLVKPPQHLTYDMMPAYFARTTSEEIEEYHHWMACKGAPAGHG